VLADTKAAGGHVWWVGNGGSASLCGHFAQDLLNKVDTRSTALSDVGLLTCMANDFGYEQVYSRPLRVLIGPSDTLVAISSSGNSPNILNAVDVALEAGAAVITFSAMTLENPLWHRPATAAFHLPSSIYGIIEIGHSALIHAIVDQLYIERHPELGSR
jgi:D-sedoheptulose 7-phosphate isomerase